MLGEGEVVPLPQHSYAAHVASERDSDTSDDASAGARTLPISELFTSIQGEGVLTGVPSFFVRTSGCNLRCTWCDTPYASWSPEGNPVPIRHIVERAANSRVRHAVITGGEPLIQKHIGALTRALSALGMHITIETAATVALSPTEAACDLMSLSPKLSNSTPAADDSRDPNGTHRERHEQRRLNVPVLQRLIDVWPQRQFKFVVTSAADLHEIETLMGRLSGWRPEDVMLMPEGVTPTDPARAEWVAQACIERGWRYCHRVHISVYGDRRGT